MGGLGECSFSACRSEAGHGGCDDPSRGPTAAGIPTKLAVGMVEVSQLSAVFILGEASNFLRVFFLIACLFCCCLPPKVEGFFPTT